MSTLSVPPRLRDGLASLGALSDECYAAFLDELRDAGSADTVQALASRIENQFPESSRASIEKIITAVDISQSVQKASHVEPSEFASDAWEALKQDAPELIAGLDREKFQARLSALISETDIQLTTSKVKELRAEVERHMCGARIISDVRPVFSQDASKPPKAMTIMHTMQIQFHDDTFAHHEFYVSVSREQLTRINEAVERAILKESTLKSMFDSKEFQIFE